MAPLRRSLATAVALGVLVSSGTALAQTAPAPTPGESSSTATATATAPDDALNEGLRPCRQQPDLKGRKPGQLVSYRELTVDPELLTGARMFRVLYTTTGVDESKVQATCGLVLIPKGQQRREVVAWAHGTMGVHQSCQPSNNPDGFLAGGAIKYGTGPNAVTGTPSNGILQGLIDQGRMITATDYYSGLGQSVKHQQNYVAAVPAGAAVLDSVRVGITLAKRITRVPGLGWSQVDATSASRPWRMALWGASQGGHSVLWAGQLARRYFRATALAHQPEIKQVGTVAAVPAASFVATHKSPRSLNGRHLGDLEMHRALSQIGSLGVGAAGPILFSQLLTSWARYATDGKVSRNAQFPGYPRGVVPRLDRVLTGVKDGAGAQTARTVVRTCVNEAGLLTLAGETQRFLDDPAANQFFVQPVWGAPDAQGQWRGRLDRTCLTDKDAGLQKWCRWLAYNTPGPEGINRFPKYPRMADGSVAPILIGEGMDDGIIYCQNSEATVPAARNCIARQLYDSLRSKKVCRSTRIQLDLFAKTPTSPATHLTTASQLADNGNAAYRGSRMDTFIKAAFSGNTKSGCSAQVVNK